MDLADLARYVLLRHGSRNQECNRTTLQGALCQKHGNQLTGIELHFRSEHVGAYEIDITRSNPVTDFLSHLEFVNFDVDIMGEKQRKSIGDY